MPFRVIRWIVRRTCEVRCRGVDVVWRSLFERGPVANGLNVVPAEIIEERKSCENTEYAEEVKSRFPVSPWDEDCPDSVWGNRGQDGGTHANRHASIPAQWLKPQLLQFNTTFTLFPSPPVQFPASWPWIHGGSFGGFFAFASFCYSGRSLLVGFLHSTQRDAFAPQVVRVGPVVNSPALRFNRLVWAPRSSEEWVLSHLPHPGRMRLVPRVFLSSPSASHLLTSVVFP